MQIKKYDVYGLGHALLDLVYHVPDEFLEKHNLSKGVRNLVSNEWVESILIDLEAEGIEIAKIAGGGSLANSLSAMQKLGAKTYLCSKVAEDQHGKKFTKELDKINLKYSKKRTFLPSNDKQHTGVCLVMATEDYERTMCTALGVCNKYIIDDLNPKAISKSKTVYMEGYILAQPSSYKVCEALCQEAHVNQVPIYISLCDAALVNAHRTSMQTFIKKNNVYCVFCNLEEAYAFSGKNTLKEAVKFLAEYTPNFIITMASHGLCAHSNGVTKKLNAIPVKCVNTLGAGDCFAGGFLYAITHGYDFFDACEFANICAAYVVSHHGPRLKNKYVKKIFSDKNNQIKDTAIALENLD